MFVKTKTDQSKPGCGQTTIKFLAKMTRCSQSFTYTRMEDDKDSAKRMKKCKGERKAEEVFKGKENDKALASKEVREKKAKKKGWKRIRQAAFTSCRYIGMGAAHMSPASMYSSPDCYVDPKYWNRSFSSSYKSKDQPPTPHWSTNMMFSGW